jgi:hypothetical protein
MNFKMRFVFVCSAIILLLVVSTARAGDLRIKENDHIVIVGNTFAERMHLFGYFETFLHSRFPEHRLRIRYLAWPAEEVGEPNRPLGFPRLADELREERADIVFVCYGMQRWGTSGTRPRVLWSNSEPKSLMGTLRPEWC